MLLSGIGIFDAVRLSMEKRREVYGLLLGMGMTGKHTHGLYFLLNHYVGKESRFQQCLPYIMVCILMAISLFGFCFFREKSIKDTDQMTERIEDARLNGMDYYMKQTDTIFSGAMQYMHQSGVTEEMYQQLATNEAVEEVRGVVCNHSTILIYDKEDSFFFDRGNGDYQINLITGLGAFQKWGLPNRNYTSVGVRLKNAGESKTFEQVWMQVLQSAGYMNSIDVYSIIQEKERTIRQTMAIFYSVLGVLLLIGILCTSNSIVMRMRYMEAEQKILHQLGLTKGRILWAYIRRYSFMAVVGTVFSMLPVMAYSFLVKNALHRIDEVLKKDATDALFRQNPCMR